MKTPKGWKKTGRSIWEKGSEQVSITLASKLTHAKKGYLVISADYPRKTFDPKYFKSKSRAIKFAYNYMKKH